jgi:hypothetical protein
VWGVPREKTTSFCFFRVEELRRSLAAFQANEQSQFARPVPQQQQQQSTQTDHFMTNPGAPQGVGGAAAQSARRPRRLLQKTKQPASESLSCIQRKGKPARARHAHTQAVRTQRRTNLAQRVTLSFALAAFVCCVRAASGRLAEHGRALRRAQHG